MVCSTVSKGGIALWPLDSVKKCHVTSHFVYTTMAASRSPRLSSLLLRTTPLSRPTWQRTLSTRGFATAISNKLDNVYDMVIVGGGIAGTALACSLGTMEYFTLSFSIDIVCFVIYSNQSIHEGLSYCTYWSHGSVKYKQLGTCYWSLLQSRRVTHTCIHAVLWK